ncbi:MAG: hypothetical protein ACFFHD_05420 [Promethearchaeota archaeon]
MSEKEKLKCPVCDSTFIPRTFYPEEAIFSTHEGKRLSGFNGYIDSSGVKPAEVILSSWVTYCPKCNYVMKFVKEIVKKEKIQNQSLIAKDIKEKYNSYYFGFPFEDYTQYLTNAANKVTDTIKTSLRDLNLTTWENMYDFRDTFKLLVRFYANLENYCNSQLNLEKNKDLPTKIKSLNLSPELEENLLELNEMRNKTIHGEYELTPLDRDRINHVVIEFILNLVDTHISPLINNKKLKSKYSYIDLKDLNSEIKVFLNGYLNNIFNDGKIVNNQIKIFLEKLIIN